MLQIWFLNQTRATRLSFLGSMIQFRLEWILDHKRFLIWDSLRFLNASHVGKKQFGTFSLTWILDMKQTNSNWETQPEPILQLAQGHLVPSCLFSTNIWMGRKLKMLYLLIVGEDRESYSNTESLPRSEWFVATAMFVHYCNAWKIKERVVC